MRPMFSVHPKALNQGPVGLKGSEVVNRQAAIDQVFEMLYEMIPLDVRQSLGKERPKAIFDAICNLYLSIPKTQDTVWDRDARNAMRMMLPSVYDKAEPIYVAALSARFADALEAEREKRREAREDAAMNLS